MTTRQKLKSALDALEKINTTIFGIGAPLGSDEYFKIRTLCCDELKKNRQYVGRRT